MCIRDSGCPDRRRARALASPPGHQLWDGALQIGRGVSDEEAGRMVEAGRDHPQPPIGDGHVVRLLISRRAAPPFDTARTRRYGGPSGGERAREAPAPDGPPY